MTESFACYFPAGRCLDVESVRRWGVFLGLKDRLSFNGLTMFENMIQIRSHLLRLCRPPLFLAHSQRTCSIQLLTRWGYVWIRTWKKPACSTVIRNKSDFQINWQNKHCINKHYSTKGLIRKNLSVKTDSLDLESVWKLKTMDVNPPTAVRVHIQTEKVLKHNGRKRQFDRSVIALTGLSQNHSWEEICLICWSNPF